MKKDEKKWTIQELVKWTISYFESRNIENPRASAEILLAYALDFKRIDIYLKYDKILSDKELQDFKALIKRRLQREPVAYIIKHKEFWSLDFEVTQDVLIPRPETECLIEAALNYLSYDKVLNILDLGTGSGAIIITLAHERPKSLYFACDISQKALIIAKKNAQKYNLENLIYFFESNWFEALKDSQKFDLIISNPPYINSQEIANLEPEIKDYEPKIALDGGQDGLVFIKHLINKSLNYLNENGILILEIGHNQKEEINKIFLENNFYKDIIFKKDYSGYDRLVCAKKRCL